MWWGRVWRCGEGVKVCGCTRQVMSTRDYHQLLYKKFPLPPLLPFLALLRRTNQQGVVAACLLWQRRTRQPSHSSLATPLPSMSPLQRPPVLPRRLTWRERQTTVLTWRWAKGDVVSVTLDHVTSTLDHSKSTLDHIISTLDHFTSTLDHITSTLDHITSTLDHITSITIPLIVSTLDHITQDNITSTLT